MLPTFVIGLREGLEAALIVGIIAAFLRKQGRLELLRWVYAGMGTAIVLCLGVGVALRVLSQDLPQKQQEGLETVIGALAVGMVTYMVVWMRRHSRDLKGVLEGATADALGGGSDRAGRALVLMAFLAVLREGFETAVFLLAAFNESGSGAGPVAGAGLGILVAVALGWGIYRGGVKLNLAKFFRVTGLVLVFVAAGLVMTAFHTAHEAGWLTSGQHHTFDMSWLVRPGTVRASLLTGILGLQPQPVVVELAAYLIYLVPVAMYVAWPPGRGVSPRRVAIAAAASAGLAAIAAGVLLLASPAEPATHPEPSGLTRSGTAVVDGMTVDRYTHTKTTDAAQGQFPSTLSAAAVAGLNGGRLPLGITASGAKVAMTYEVDATTEVEVAPETNRVISTTTSERVTATAHSALGAFPLPGAVPLPQSGAYASSTNPTQILAALAAARHDRSTLGRRDDLRDAARWLAAGAVVLLIGAAGAAVAGRRTSTRPPATPVDSAARPLIDTQVSLT